MNERCSSRPRSSVLAAFALVATVSFGTSTASAVVVTPRLALDGHDPVELCEGREKPGALSDSLVHGAFVYRFASPESRERFLANPARWGIQNAGACGKMGVLSGAGSPSRWLVQDGHVYVFASETCRERFRAEPASFVHKADPVPVPTAQEAKRAHQVLDQAAKAFGPPLDKARTLELRLDARYVARDSSVSTSSRLHQWEFPGRYREHEAWPKLTYGFAADGNTSFQFDDDGDLPHDADVSAVVLRQVWREPLLLVRSRRDPALVARWTGQEQVAGEKADLVEVSIHGATTVLAVSSRSGRVLEARFPARTTLGDRPVVQRYSEFRKVKGLELPNLSERFEGTTRRSPELRLVDAKLDVALDAASFSPSH